MTLDELIAITYPLANLDFEQRVQLAEKAALMINKNNQSDISRDGLLGYPHIVDPFYVGSSEPDLMSFEGMNLTNEQLTELDDIVRVQTLIMVMQEE